ncbi:hypothetical protein H0H92_003136 [Tricholoma furcatifolium]|nr:hypothetical protein H0H92_003136 [Tricholoma furcatifolium]
MSVWSREAVAERILKGDALIVYNGHLLRIPPSWLAAHPGGSLAILHFVGRDATDEIQAYHSDHTLDIIQRYSIGRVELVDDAWPPFVPPVMSGWVRKSSRWFSEASAQRSAVNTELSPSSQILLVTSHSQNGPDAPDRTTLEPSPSSLSLEIQAQHSAAYKALHKRITNAGLYKTPYLTGYGPEVLRYLLLASASAFTYHHSWFMTSAVFLGLTWQQLAFAAHDLGHMGVTHIWAIDRILGILIADFIGGLSIGWWVENHNVHHIVTNHPSHDPDIEHIPFLAISPVFLTSLWSSFYKRTMWFDPFAKIFISMQHKLFYIIMLFGRFNLCVNSYSFLFRKAFDTRRARGGRWAWTMEVIGLIFYWFWFGRVLYGCGSWQSALAYLLPQIVLSHFSMSTADLGPTESFPHRQLRTTSDVICDESIGFIHGGLHLQVTHHLFPRLPRHNLKRASFLVKEFAREQGLTYAEFGFVDGNAEVIGVLRGVAEQVKLMGKVANAEVKEAIEKQLGEKKAA